MMLLAGLSIAAMVLITAVDVVFRYALNAPFSWSHDLITHYLLVALFFLALPQVTRSGAHMSLDYAVRNLKSPWLRNGFSAFGDLLGLLLAVGIGYGGWQTTVAAWQAGEMLQGALAVPTWPANFLVPLGSAVLSLRLLIRLIAALEATLDGRIAMPPPLAH